MAIGERIRFLRNLRGMTQRHLGMAVGFSEKTADVRIAQYETGTRTPKAEGIAALAQALAVSPQALTVPDIDSDLGLMHTLFALEDLRGLRISEHKEELCLCLDRCLDKCPDKGTRPADHDLIKMLTAWRHQAARLEAGEITKEQYDQWRYGYSPVDATQE